MNNLINAGWDPGRLNNKLYLENKRIINMNAICSGYERRILEADDGDPVNFLDVDIFQGDDCLGRYFVGGMAYKHHRGDLRWAANGIPKFEDASGNCDEIVRMVTHLALSQYDSKDLKKKVYFRLGTGSPTEEYFENTNPLHQFAEIMKKPYRVVFKHPMFKGAEIEVLIPKMHFKPEGTASMISMAYEDDLWRKDEIFRIFEKGLKIIGINIGSSTTDVAIMKPDMTFDPGGFFGIDVGTSNALNLMRSQLYKDYGYDIPKVKLDFLIRKYQKVRYKGSEIDLEKLKKKPFDDMLALLKTKFFDQLEMRGIVPGEAGAVYISGGAAAMVGNKLENFVPGVPSKISLDPLYEDARGYFLEAKINELLESRSEVAIFENDEELVGVE
jgi:plasmid segregation protein ParM